MTYVVLTRENYDKMVAELNAQAAQIEGEWDTMCEHENPDSGCEVMCSCGHPCGRHVHILNNDDSYDNICCVKGCDCGLIEQIEQLPEARITGISPYFMSFQAAGRFRWRVGKTLSDGRTVWLNPHQGDITGNSYALGMRTWIKLRYAVRAAKEWKREAVRHRRTRAASWLVGGLGVAALWLGALKRDSK